MRASLFLYAQVSCTVSYAALYPSTCETPYCVSHSIKLADCGACAHALLVQSVHQLMAARTWQRKERRRVC